MFGHAAQNLLIRKIFLLSGLSCEYKDLAKFADDTDYHFFAEELKRRHYSLQALRPKANYLHASAKQKFHEI